MASEPVAAEHASTSEDSRGPVVVLSYAGAGAELLTRILSVSRSLACTSGTGLLPLCHSAAMTWQRAERRENDLSPLAVKSVRSLASMIIAVIQAQTGASRWCETALAPSAAAGTFLRLFPSTAFLCLHRRLSSVLSESLLAYPWGLGGRARTGRMPRCTQATMSRRSPPTGPPIPSSYLSSNTCILSRVGESGMRISKPLRESRPARSSATSASIRLIWRGFDSRRLMSQTKRGYGDPSLATPAPIDLLPRQLQMRVTELYDQLGYRAWLDSG
jgi:hypothetical protein